MPEAVRDTPVFVGLPLGSWAFAIRVWLAMVFALHLAFWLELEAPTSAALTVAILALPSRGQGMEKAAFRLAATVVGVFASIAIFGIFSQTGALLLAVVAIWIGICVYTVGLLDGNRAYAAALGIITISLVAIEQIDSPQNVFDAGLARGSAIAVGIIAITLANDLLATPDYYPKVCAQLTGLHRRVMDYIDRVLRGEAGSNATAAELLRDITKLRPEISSLATESSSGPARSTAARNTLVDLVYLLSTVRELETLPLAASQPLRERIAGALADAGGAALPSGTLPGEAEGAAASAQLCFSWLARELIHHNRKVQDGIRALQAGTQPGYAWRAPLFRPYRVAVASGIRAAIGFALISAILVTTGWPSTENCLALVAVLIGLGAISPDARATAKLSVIVIPFACLIAGLLEFVVLDGVDAFPLLAISLAPLVMGSALLMTLANPLLVSVGRLTLIFVVAVLGPTNPQSYNPESFLFITVFACLAAFLLYAVQFLVPPVSNEERLRWLLASAPELPRHRKLAPEEASFRDATRIAQMVAAGATAPQNIRSLEEAMVGFDRRAAFRMCASALNDASLAMPAELMRAARSALDRGDQHALLDLAQDLHRNARANDAHVTAARGALVLASLAAATLSAPDRFEEKPQ